ncbi:cysteinyl-tRNA synthetase [Pirellula staleyi DSM 6068]|uniref:Cysteine--tRNA ligase n=1 Tax=Pirellula staleyi (strain ATCC 27377 / DSM 6068 / ICPB 4128) TaxID=530564 RepID=D2QZ58_PIRSD|nr:cysteine--tRNA ligase [Pirellula staleyi]ADB18250.1 cysteinyl-tRNA synthetase [Pirellula staleyi DSM 6068]
MSIRVYNTLSKTKEPFVPVVAGKVGIYLCGPTVYKESHIGHMVGPVIFDTIKRYLTYCGYQVTWVVNITDVDDKLIGQMRERNLPMSEIAAEMVVDYLNNLKALGVDQIDRMPKATEYMDDIIRFIEDLIKKDFAYAAGGDVFFDVGRDAQYGKLSNRSADSQQGEGGEAASRKRSPSDFALWKSAKPGEPAWDSPWGQGRPGWHIECSAMSRAILGETFDIHGGGLDLVFPHHENELAQSECCSGKPMVNFWMHNGLLRASSAAGKVGGKGDREEAAAPQPAGKMSRSGGAGGLADVIAEQGGERIRFFLLKTHYRSTVVYGPEGLEESSTALESFYRFFERFQRITKQRFFNLPPTLKREDGEFDPAGDPLLTLVHGFRQGFLEKMDDDFNTGGAMSDLFEMVREMNKFADQNKLDEVTQLPHPQVAILVKAAKTLRELTSILGLFLSQPAKRGGGGDAVLPKVMQLMMELRTEARNRKDFATADRIRLGLAEMGIALEDRKGTTEWRIGSSS